jgi:putative salt-induced outer membrane protein YdiY
MPVGSIPPARRSGDSGGMPAKGRSGVWNDLRAVIRRGLVGAAVVVALAGVPALAQEDPGPAPTAAPCPCAEPPATPPVWTGSFGAGLALTQGNKDTTNFNLSFDLKRDPKTRTIFKAEGLYILATENGDENVDRGLFNIRLERMISERAYVFGQLAYVRDRFKDIDYLIAPTAGLGYKLIANERTTLDIDGSLGVVVEKNTGFDVETDGAVAAGEKFSHRISDSATFTQGAAALWRMDDFGDALYTFSAGLAASVTTRVQLKIEFQDIFKTRPTGADVEKNDVALITAFVYKF